MRPRVVLLADGASKDSHMDNSRMLSRINGKPLLVRTIQQFNPWADVLVVSSDEKITRVARMQRMTWTAPSAARTYGGINMIHEGLLHAHNKRSIITFGDVVWTDAAIETIRDHAADNWAVYGRSVASQYGGSPYAEYFAIEVDPLGRKHGRHAVQQVWTYYQDGEWPRATPWEWYYHMEKMPYHIRNPQAIETGPHWVEIHDATDDIDFEKDIQAMREAHSDQV